MKFEWMKLERNAYSYQVETHMLFLINRNYPSECIAEISVERPKQWDMDNGLWRIDFNSVVYIVYCQVTGNKGKFNNFSEAKQHAIKQLSEMMELVVEQTKQAINTLPDFEWQPYRKNT